MFSRFLTWRLLARTATLVALFASLSAAEQGAQSVEEKLPSVSTPSPAVMQDAYLPGPTVAQRLQEISMRVDSAKNYPEIARMRGVTGKVLVGFKIGADGVAQEVTTLESSGSGTLDRAATQAVERAGVLPWVWGDIAVPVHFELKEAN
jgi:TonB family protein